jgi:hypothetical protein
MVLAAVKVAEVVALAASVAAEAVATRIGIQNSIFFFLLLFLTHFYRA